MVREPTQLCPPSVIPPTSAVWQPEKAWWTAGPPADRGRIAVGFENKEKVNASEARPKDGPSEQTVRALGAAAVKGSQRSR